jgi:YbbR domain-containing protein
MVRGYDRELDLRPIGIRPQTVELQLERRVSRRVPVEPRLRLSAAPGFAVIRPVLLQPDSVTLRGAETEVASVERVATEQAVLEELRTTVTRELQLAPPEGLRSVDWDPEAVLATVEVDSLVERSVERPVQLRGPAAGMVALDRESVEVRLRGPATVVGRVNAARVRVYVTVDTVPSATIRVPVEVEIGTEAPLTADADPADVAVRPVGGAAGEASDG